MLGPPQLGGEHKPEESSASYLTEKIHRLPNQKRGKGLPEEQCSVLNTLDAPHRELAWAGLLGCRVCTSQLTDSVSPHISMEETSWPAVKTKVTNNGKHSFGQTNPKIWLIFSCSGSVIYGFQKVRKSQMLARILHRKGQTHVMR